MWSSLLPQLSGSSLPSVVDRVHDSYSQRCEDEQSYKNFSATLHINKGASSECLQATSTSWLTKELSNDLYQYLLNADPHIDAKKDEIFTGLNQTEKPSQIKGIFQKAKCIQRAIIYSKIISLLHFDVEMSFHLWNNGNSWVCLFCL